MKMPRRCRPSHGGLVEYPPDSGGVTALRLHRTGGWGGVGWGGVGGGVTDQLWATLRIQCSCSLLRLVPLVHVPRGNKTCPAGRFTTVLGIDEAGLGRGEWWWWWGGPLSRTSTVPDIKAGCSAGFMYDIWVMLSGLDPRRRGWRLNPWRPRQNRCHAEKRRGGIHQQSVGFGCSEGGKTGEKVRFGKEII